MRLNVDVPGYCGAADVLALELRTTPHDWAALGQAMVDMNLAWTAGTAGSDRDPFVGYSELLDYDGQTMVALDSLGHYGYPDQDREGEETARLHVAAAAEICA